MPGIQTRSLSLTPHISRVPPQACSHSTTARGFRSTGRQRAPARPRMRPRVESGERGMGECMVCSWEAIRLLWVNDRQPSRRPELQQGQDLREPGDSGAHYCCRHGVSEGAKRDGTGSNSFTAQGRDQTCWAGAGRRARPTRGATAAFAVKAPGARTRCDIDTCRSRFTSSRAARGGYLRVYHPIVAAAGETGDTGPAAARRAGAHGTRAGVRAEVPPICAGSPRCACAGYPGPLMAARRSGARTTPGCATTPSSISTRKLPQQRRVQVVALLQMLRPPSEEMSGSDRDRIILNAARPHGRKREKGVRTGVEPYHAKRVWLGAPGGLAVKHHEPRPVCIRAELRTVGFGQHGIADPSSAGPPEPHYARRAHEKRHGVSERSTLVKPNHMLWSIGKGCQLAGIARVSGQHGPIRKDREYLKVADGKRRVAADPQRGDVFASRVKVLHASDEAVRRPQESVADA